MAVDALYIGETGVISALVDMCYGPSPGMFPLVKAYVITA